MKKQIIFLILCIITAVVTLRLTPHQLLADADPVVIDDILPKNIQGWSYIESSSDEALISSPELEKNVKNVYSQVLSRRYISPDGYQIMLSVAYTRDQSDNSGKNSHKPDLCYPAQGFEIRHRQTGVIDATEIPVVRLFAVNQNRYEPLTYFTTVGNTVANTAVDVKIAQVRYSLEGYIPDGLIFRVSSIDEDYTHAYKRQDEFTAALLKAIVKHNDRILPMVR